MWRWSATPSPVVVQAVLDAVVSLGVRDSPVVVQAVLDAVVSLGVIDSPVVVQAVLDAVVSLGVRDVAVVSNSLTCCCAGCTRCCGIPGCERGGSGQQLPHLPATSVQTCRGSTG